MPAKLTFKNIEKVVDFSRSNEHKSILYLLFNSNCSRYHILGQVAIPYLDINLMHCGVHYLGCRKVRTSKVHHTMANASKNSVSQQKAELILAWGICLWKNHWCSVFCPA